jgi:biotin transporter BioY
MTVVAQLAPEQLFTVAKLAVGLNLVLLALLGWVWLRNYVDLRSKHTLGMLVFASLLFVENAFALYTYQFDSLLSGWFNTAVPAEAWTAMLLFHVLETVALSFLAWVTLD